ncbi:hypothetical protein [Kaistella sp.]|uniref:hypothetical protein n=1 Tax=Kaistella sp. TaxID=2782235 RepID=UPI003C312879
MKLKFKILFAFFSILGNAQNLKTSNILKVSDSILLQNTKSNLFPFFKFSDGSYYKYSKGIYERTGKFITNKKIKNNVTEIWVLYSFKYPKIEGVKGGTWIKLDKNLNLIEPVSLEFIPEFLRKNERSNFIPKEVAYNIAIENFIKEGIKIENPELFFDKNQNAYVYMIINKLNEYKNFANKPAGNTEVIKINAENGKIVEKFDGYYGLIIR